MYEIDKNQTVSSEGTADGRGAREGPPRAWVTLWECREARERMSEGVPGLPDTRSHGKRRGGRVKNILNQWGDFQ